MLPDSHAFSTTADAVKLPTGQQDGAVSSIWKGAKPRPSEEARAHPPVTKRERQRLHVLNRRLKVDSLHGSHLPPRACCRALERLYQAAGTALKLHTKGSLFRLLGAPPHGWAPLLNRVKNVTLILFF